MEDQVPFKVFTFWREGEKPEVRRFGVEKSVVTSFHYLNAKLQDVYPGLKGKTYSVAWRDEDGDDVVVSSDEEVMTALQALNGDIIKLFVYAKVDEAKDDDCDIVFTTLPSNPHGPISSDHHFGVMCDACDGKVIGFRYKCSVCDDFDLCSRCEAAGLHPEHCMVRVPTPNMPRTVIKAAIKRSRHFLKSVAATVGEDCPYKKHRSERSGERKHRGHHGPHGTEQGPHGPHGPHGEHPRRRNRVSWIDTFTTYMNEFANLAGDIDLTGDDGKPKAPETKTPGQSAETQAQNPQETQETAQTATDSTQAPKPEASTSAHAGTQCPFMPRKTINVLEIQNLLENFIRGNYMPETSQPQPPTANAAAPTPAAAAAAGDVVMGQGDKKAAEADLVSVKTELPRESSSASSVTSASDLRDASPDKADDWTMINKEKDLMDTASALPAAPIGFNLPEEFQERVKISTGALYPPLNSSTAGHDPSLLTHADRLVLNPKEPEVMKPTPAPTAPPAPAAAAPAFKPQEKPAVAKPQTPPQPRQRHPQAHIDAAIQHMLAMGFTNEGGWLTQLLESKDGNIAAVLDLLTPVNPKK